MTDQTPIFRQCVNIIHSELNLKDKSDDTLLPPYIIKDTFTKESSEVYQILVNLNQFTNEIKSNYLSINDEQKNAISVRDKDKIDEEFQLKVQQLYKKLTFLETYESKRNDLVSKKSWNSIFGGKSDQSIYFETLFNHRNSILKFLMDAVNFFNKKFTTMQLKRQTRERQLDSLNFQNIDDEVEDLDDIQITNFSELEQSSVPEYTQQQIQELETENKEFLDLKTNQLRQVEKIQHSIMDIINIQNELSFKLQSQGEQIENLIDTHSQVESEVQMGNKTLNQATKKNKRGANLLVTLCFVLGVLIVLIDYIKFI